jgi:hypothetical protein
MYSYIDFGHRFYIVYQIYLEKLKFRTFLGLCPLDPYQDFTAEDICFFFFKSPPPPSWDNTSRIGTYFVIVSD